jgi:Fur family transcriptional regulator, ferric uptake regulator
MTQAPDVAPLAAENLEQAVAALRARGLRLSAARRLILKALFVAPVPLSAEQLAAQLGLDLASTYRNLETFERHGLIRHVHLGHGPGLYLVIARGERAYLFCESCREVREIAPEELTPVRDRVRELFGYEAGFTHFPIVGRCPDCHRHRAPNDAHPTHLPV